MLQDILLAGWFLFPAALANAAPIAAARLPWLKKFNTPIDGNKTWRGRRILGAHKTWRGLFSGIVVATFVLWVQTLLYIYTDWGHAVAGHIDYATLPLLLLGPAFGLGALGGDAIKSFFKRQKGIPAGESWLPFDQLDYIIGSVLITLPFVVLTPLQYVLVFIIWFVLHLIASYFGYKLGLKERPI